MSNVPKQPEDPPTEGTAPGGMSPGEGGTGIPAGQGEHDAASLPTDDRHDTETAPGRTGGG